MGEKGFIGCPACKKAFSVILSGHGEHARRCPHCGALLMLKNRWPKRPSYSVNVGQWFRNLWAFLNRPLFVKKLTEQEQIDEAINRR
ncbi:MAG TPA: hypothetical protein PLV42_07065 [bacterium]|nr:hypothetical protein [bacterium]